MSRISLGLLVIPILALQSLFESTPTTQVSAPFVIPPSTAPVEQVWACEAGGWAERLKGLRGIGNSRIECVPEYQPNGEPAPGLLSAWTTDEWVFGWVGRQPAVLHLAGDRGLAEWGKRTFATNGWQWLEVGEPREGEARRFDAGGNVLVSPPVPGRFPHGRLLVGRDMQGPAKSFLRRQGMQTGPGNTLIEIDTSWLQVGHVDEVVAFLPNRIGRGFQVVLPDPEAGLRLLAQAPPERVLFYRPGSREAAGRVTAGAARQLEVRFPATDVGHWKYLKIVSGKGAGQVALIRRAHGSILWIERVWDLRGSSPSLALRDARQGRCESMPIWFEVPDVSSRCVVVEDAQQWLDGSGDEFPALITAGELVADAGLQKAMLHCAAKLAEIEKHVTAGLGMAPGRVVRLPVLFHADRQGRDAGALLPNPVNLVNLGEGVLLLRPFGPRRDPRDDDSDLFAAAWRKALASPAARIDLLDGWNGLHRLNGGARCGTNVRRQWPGCNLNSGIQVGEAGTDEMSLKAKGLAPMVESLPCQAAEKAR